jgi:polysaccharide biosynthesis/export protein
MSIRLLSSIFIVISVFIFTSCVTTSKVAYFENAQDTTYRKNIGATEAPLQKNDFLSIAISSLSPEASAIFNPIYNSGEKTANNESKNAQYVGYLISSDGYIQLPILGNIMAAGLTKKQLKEYITRQLIDKKLLVDPIVDIRYLNFEVTILGEVASPTVITVPSEKISLVKALGMAGDLTIYGKRENVLLIREELGVRKTIHINLNSSDFLNSDYYYLRPNDVIYVEPNKAKIAVTGKSQQVIPFIVTAASTIVAVVLSKVIK